MERLHTRIEIGFRTAPKKPDAIGSAIKKKKSPEGKVRGHARFRHNIFRVSAGRFSSKSLNGTARDPAVDRIDLDGFGGLSKKMTDHLIELSCMFLAALIVMTLINRKPLPHSKAPISADHPFTQVSVACFPQPFDEKDQSPPI